MKTLLRIIAIALRHPWLLVGAYAAMVGATAAYLTLPWLFGKAIDEIARAFQDGTASDTAVLSTAALILAMGSIRGVLALGQVYLGEVLAQAVVFDLRNRFYDHVQHLSFGFHDRHHTGNLMSRAISDVEAMRMFVNGGLIRTPYFIIQIVVVAFILLRLDWRLGLLGIGFMPFLALLSTFVRLQLARIWRRVQEDMAELSTVLQENLTGVRVVKAFASEEFEEGKFRSKSTDVSDDMVRAARLRALSVSFMIFAFLVSLGLVLWYGGSRVIDGYLTPGQLAQFLFYLQILATPVRWFGMVINNFVRAIISGQRLFEILDIDSPVQEADNAVPMPRVRGHVRFENVAFSYGDGDRVLRAINIDAKPGTTVALLGPPGSGKSTIAHLLPRFYEVDSGRITIDGLDIRDATLKSLRRNIGIVPQDVVLFTASIRENIAYGREDASLEEVVEAARVAQLDEYIQSLEEGYETIIGERGATLSGGQRQRLSIARAVLLDPPVLILDDSTASVDASTEERIRKAMESVMRGRTTFVVAHRLSTVHMADQILVIEDGAIAERGTHSELLARGGHYRDIYDLQLRPQEQVMMEFDVSAGVPMEKPQS